MPIPLVDWLERNPNVDGASLDAYGRFVEYDLAIDEASYGPDHPEVAIDLNNLANLFQDTDRYEEAEPLMRRALAIDEASYGPDHPEVATDLGNLALVLRGLGDAAAAEPLLERALAISEEAYGPNHPETQRLLKTLSGLESQEPQ